MLQAGRDTKTLQAMQDMLSTEIWLSTVADSMSKAAVSLQDEAGRNAKALQALKAMLCTKV